MDTLRRVLRWSASALLVLVALLAVVASLVLQFVFGNLVEPPRPALLSVLILFVLPVALVGCSIYVASAWLYRGDRQLSWVVHIQHTWMLYALIAVAAYSLSQCAVARCDADSASIYRVLGLGAMCAIAANLLAYVKRRHAIARLVAA